MAAGALQGAADRGRHVPKDVSVVGFDDIQLAGLLRPSLTTIRQDKQGLGRAAAEALVRLIVDPELEAPSITLPVELIVRGSSVDGEGEAVGMREGAGCRPHDRARQCGQARKEGSRCDT
jgi:LacI family transcriptional regulator